jgi:hypothetical protein
LFENPTPRSRSGFRPRFALGSETFLPHEIRPFSDARFT